MHLHLPPRGVRRGLFLCVLATLVAPAAARADVVRDERRIDGGKDGRGDHGGTD